MILCWHQGLVLPHLFLPVEEEGMGGTLPRSVTNTNRRNIRKELGGVEEVSLDEYLRSKKKKKEKKRKHF